MSVSVSVSVSLPYIVCFGRLHLTICYGPKIHQDCGLPIWGYNTKHQPCQYQYRRIMESTENLFQWLVLVIQRFLSNKEATAWEMALLDSLAMLLPHSNIHSQYYRKHYQLERSGLVCDAIDESRDFFTFIVLSICSNTSSLMFWTHCPKISAHAFESCKCTSSMKRMIQAYRVH